MRQTLSVIPFSCGLLLTFGCHNGGNNGSGGIYLGGEQRALAVCKAKPPPAQCSSASCRTASYRVLRSNGWEEGALIDDGTTTTVLWSQRGDTWRVEGDRLELGGPNARSVPVDTSTDGTTISGAPGIRWSVPGRDQSSGSRRRACKRPELSA